MNGTVLGLFLVVSILVYSNYADDDMSLEKLEEECKKESGFNGEMTELSSETSVKQLKCFLKCLMENTEIMFKNGTVNTATEKLLVESDEKMNATEKERHLKIIDECIAELKPDPKDSCDSAFTYFFCKQTKLGDFETKPTK